jgi:hypothetical protein
VRVQASYKLPTESAKDKLKLARSLQQLFYHMQVANEAPGTSELTGSFGWTHAEAFTQHDVQEFSRVLCDRLVRTHTRAPARECQRVGAHSHSDRVCCSPR